MQSQEKQEVIEKIKNLIESGNQKNIQLALQLMEGFNLKKEIATIYGLEENYLRNLVMFKTEQTQEATKNTLAAIEKILDFYRLSSGIKRKVFSIVVELLQYIIENSSIEDSKISLNFHNKYLLITNSYIQDLKLIEEEVECIKIINSKNRVEFKNFFRNTMKSDFSKTNRVVYKWADLGRRLFRNPTEYATQIDDKGKYIFTIKIKIDI